MKINELEFDAKKAIIALSVFYKGDWDKIYKVVSRKEDVPFGVYEAEYYYRHLSCKAITICDEEYPEHLKRACKPPFVLFYLGDISLINETKNCLSVVGTREPTSTGTMITQQIIYGLKPEIVVVSGMARGIDTIAHESAIDSHHRTVAVLGCGLNNCFPPSNESLFEHLKKYELVISEYPPEVSPLPDNFPKRNRIIAGLSYRLLVTEAKKRSGTSITMNFANDMGNDVLCVPSANYNDSITNIAIKQGAALVENCEDVNYFFER